MSAPQNFTVKFCLTVTVEGASLQAIDDGLIQAAGQRLAARMQNPPTLNGAPIVPGPVAYTPPPAPVAPTVVREEPHPAAPVGGDHQAGSESGVGSPVSGGPDDVGGAEPVAAKAKRGVKPGSTRGPYKKSLTEEVADESPAAQAPPAAPPQAQPAGPFPTLDQCVAALTKVNKEKSTDVAYKCLTDMGVKRCGEIPEARRAEFIAKCDAAAAGA